MRFLSGLVLGAVLLIGAAYLRDASIDPVRAPGAKTLVNWDVASGVVRTASAWVRGQVDWIGQQLHRQG